MRTDVDSSHVIEQIAQDHLLAAIMHLKAYEASWWTSDTYKEVIEKKVSPIIKKLQELS